MKAFILETKPRFSPPPFPFVCNLRFHPFLVRFQVLPLIVFACSPFVSKVRFLCFLFPAYRGKNGKRSRAFNRASQRWGASL